MTHPSQEEMDEGEIMVLLERLHIALPNLLDLKQRVLAGDTLSDLEIVELDMMLDHASDARGPAAQTSGIPENCRPGYQLVQRNYRCRCGE